ncbi:MAG: outer membrane beta-barrel protein, partial [Maribacter sp.]|nr:outer membrane beta-barrel protein [Maribacter sp.]
MRFSIIFLLLACTQLTIAQTYGSGNVILRNSNQFIINWEVAIPNNSNYVTKTSFSNGRAEYRYLYNDQFAIGASIGWNSFSEKVDRQLYETPDGSNAVFTDLIRQVYKLPISLDGYYYIGAGEDFRPYVGLGLGANYAQQEVYYNVFVTEDKNWGFLARPEIGAQYMFSRDMG